jgi:hypothetical protein
MLICTVLVQHIFDSGFTELSKHDMSDCWKKSPPLLNWILQMGICKAQLQLPRFKQAAKAMMQRTQEAKMIHVTDGHLEGLGPGKGNP